MSCLDSKSPKKRKNLLSGNMGDIIGKEPDDAEIDEMSQEFTDNQPTREDADGAPSSEEQDTQNGINNHDEDDLSVDEITQKDETPCGCDACKDRRTAAAENLEEMRRLQAHWIELRQYIRMVYRMAMEDKPPTTDGYQVYIKELVSKLCMCDPHQLFQRLESQVQEFVIEAKVRQLELLNREKDSSDLPKLFISGLLDSYKKLMAAAGQLTPLLEQLQNEHLVKFNLSWKVLNQHLYQSCVYTDPSVQTNVPVYIALLSNTTNEDAEANKKLVRDFLGFDDEITLVGGMWREAETRIHQYNQEQATLKAKQRMLKEDWELFKAQRKLMQQKIWNKSSNEQLCKANDDSSCPHRSCPCDDCTMTQLLSYGGFVTPPHSHSPTSSYSSHKSDSGVRVEGEGREQADVSPDCECHVCTAPPVTTPVVDLETGAVNPNLHGGGFHLYPHIHGTGGVVGEGVNGVYPHLYNIHPSLLPSKQQNSPEHMPINHLQEEKSGGPGIRPTTPPIPPPQRPDPPPVTAASPTVKPTGAARTKPHRHSTTQTALPAHQHSRLHQSLPDVVKSAAPTSCHKHAEPIKRVACAEHGDEDDDTSPEDSCSERSSSTQRDSRHCDCCYCEVFGHGVPSVAPVSRNYQEMRERLRLLLTKKKAKCKSGPVPGNNTTPNSNNPVPPNNHANTAPAQVNNTTTPLVDPVKSKDTRDLEDLLDFIEGNPNSKCKDEKKAAKKARQKQKKQEEIDRKKREEEEAERRRLEEEAAAAALLKQQQKALAKKKKKKNKAATNNNSNSSSNKAAKVEQVPQMVTIKRVMEPNSAEPTVTITLRGATPNEDKVLYTLLNGQVCQVQKDSKNSRGKQTPGGNNKNKNSVNIANNIVITSHNHVLNGHDGNKNNKNSKKVTVNVKSVNQIKKNEDCKVKPPTPQLTSPTAIQINNAINRLSRPPLPSNFSLDNLKLPPGITITKVDPAQVSQRRPIQIKQSAPPPAPTPPPTVPSASNVIVVDTGKLKDINNIVSKANPEDMTNGIGKKKKKKKGNGNEGVNTMNNNNNIVTLTMNGAPKNLLPPPPLQNGKVMMPSQAAIIKLNGSMVTIRSPALQQALTAKSDPVVEQSKKKKKKKKGGNGQGQNEECLDSVFAPKDIDLENGDMDDAERELEAFKRFCFQSVPPKRKEKVHLNIKDIVLKKKSSAISCS